MTCGPLIILRAKRRKTQNTKGTWCEWVGAILLTLCTLITFSNVWLRYAFRSPLQWGEEVTILLLLGFVYITQFSNEINGDQIRLTLLRVKSKTVEKIITAITSLVTLAVLVTLVVYGWQVVQLNVMLGVKTNVTRLPLWIFYGILSLSFLGMAVARVVFAISSIFGNALEEDGFNKDLLNDSVVEKVEVS